ncbi:Ataxin-3 like [Quillaja saponaria]|uniref:ubiquitinyl hydrolase 1 n=1 Tax=Quillaja saponaria TaxID=32244 RepID=A0AAD7PMR8_QUISA|nr:Ataxin-3 like [Quillaja saponaria]
MEGVSNGGMLYHEVQESKLCAVHCVNSVLQGPFFSEFDLAALASDLDRKERQMMLQGGASSGDFLSEESHNVSLDGDFSIQVLQKALEVWDLQVIPLDSPVAEPAQIDPEMESAFICHLQDHWFCIRKVNGEWYNFDSLYAAPQHLSKFYLSAYLDSLKGFGWSIFLVRGNFPKEFPISSSEASNGFGQWLLPEDAERITKSCNSVQAAPPQRIDGRQQSDPLLSNGEAEMLSDMEDEDLKAAIAASLIDSSPAVASTEAETPQNDNQNSKRLGIAETSTPQINDKNSKELAFSEAGNPQSDSQNSIEVAIAEAGIPQSDSQNSIEVVIAEAGTPQSVSQNIIEVATDTTDTARDDKQ